ncbi:hypothetical protein ASG11_01990 [Sphingomonas sp. Leaf357]|uniref:DUF1697 domain-containing protein n=1 Tax=Sphingomonas sp. Leaf357 TaxID=1736350 RepID=UPI0006FCD845|nr:DUF1697 domain-containing protein [Sphingomonas sp. Leaf357]KQS03183.1 hypothetical protein ASG11_01990 [Sphingomonas sp. Leaf357]
MKRWAALLRGVNLGGRKLLMADLKRIAEGLGFIRVETLLASGNVVFDATQAGPEIEAMLEAALATHGLKTDVVVRDLADLRAVIAANPHVAAVLDHPSHVLVTFHREPFPTDRLSRLAEVYDGAERLHAFGRELYTDYLGQQQMRETRLLQGMNKAKFPKVATARNWNTVIKLADMLG